MLLLFLFRPVNVPYVIFLLYVHHEMKSAKKYTLISFFSEKQWFNAYFYREEKSLRHVAMVAKFLDDSKPKIHLKVNYPCFKLHRSYSISFTLSNVSEIFWGLIRRGVPEFRKRKRNCVVFTYSVKRVREIRKFHVAVAQRWQKNVQKSMMHVQSCCFTNVIIYTKKLLNSDWLRKECSSSVTRVQNV